MIQSLKLAYLSRFTSSNAKLSSAEYVERMKDKQESIFYMAGGSKDEVEKSPFVERLIKKGYEVLYLTEAVDEYAISALPLCLSLRERSSRKLPRKALALMEIPMQLRPSRKQFKEKFDHLLKWLGPHYQG
jgi:heat shock protein beta